LRAPTLAALGLVLAGCATAPARAPAAAVLWLGGDVHLGAGDGRALALLRDVTGGEPALVNLEGPLGDDAGASSAARLVNAPSVPRVLASVGVWAAGVENNHADDLGAAGRDATRAGLEAAGVTPLGLEHRVLGGGVVALAAVDLSRPVDASALESQLRRLRVGATALIVTFHVTAPPSYLPTPELEAAVEAALAAGASVVAAHGTHALARVERRGRAVIAWGLGNLVFACQCTDEDDGLLLRVELDATGGVTRATVVPVEAGLHGAPLRLAADPGLTLQLLESLGSSPLRRAGDRADF
jgi:poly-gamma-glutamate capsule biosynthesis protein CapA/YwtB (metallophosphatase superfamily)